MIPATSTSALYVVNTIFIGEVPVPESLNAVVSAIDPNAPPVGPIKTGQISQEVARRHFQGPSASSEVVNDYAKPFRKLVARKRRALGGAICAEHSTPNRPSSYRT
jgi:hypothetical protein